MPQEQAPEENLKHEPNPQWSRQFDGMIREAVRLEAACGLKINDPNTAERVLKGDETVCARANPTAFRKLRELYMAFFGTEIKAIDRLGAERVVRIIESKRELLEKLRRAEY